MGRWLSSPPRWLSLLIGLAAIAAGAVLTFKPFDSLDALTLFIGASLILAGLGEFLGSDGEAAEPLDRVMGVLLMLTGLAALLLRDQTIRFIAVAVGIGLVVSGIARLWSLLRRRTDERYAALAGGLASVVLGILSLSWPDVTILAVALIVGPVAVILGVRQLLNAIRGSQTRAASHAATAPEQPSGRSTLRRRFSAVSATAALLLALVLVAVSAYLNDEAPTVSAFYSAPDDLPDMPGHLLRSDDFSRGLPENSRAVRILYTTTALDGSIGVGSGIVVIPTAEPREPWPVVPWFQSTTGVAQPCAPSILADPLGSGAMPAQQATIDNGWVVVAPDYIGLGTEGPHPYLIGPPTARSSLDAVRAARQIEGLSLSDRTVAWGHSQGGGVALWVGIEARAYAPDVPLAGLAAMAPASDLPRLATGMQGNPAGQLFAAFILHAYSQVYPDVNFNDYVRASAREVLNSVVTRCLSEPATLLSLGAVLSGENLYTGDLTNGALALRLAENVPSAPSGVPIFLTQGLADTLVTPAAQDGFANALCAAGQVVEFHTYAGRDHLSVVADDSPMVADLLTWTTARFAGEPAATSCTVTER